MFVDGTDLVPVGSGGVAGSIDDLADVDTSTTPPSGGQALLWDTTASRWKPASVGSGGGETEIVYDPVPITNPDAETGNLSGWTEEAGSWSAPSSAGSMTAAHGGTYFFYNQSSNDGILTQTIDLIAAGFIAEALDDSAVFRLTAWAGSAYTSDTGIFEVDWLDAADAVLDTDSSGEFGPTDPLGSWEEVTLIGSIPAGARKIKLRLQTINHSGSNSTYAFDEIALEIGTQQAAPLALNDLADVDLATTAPVAGDTLVFEGTDWLPAQRQIEITGGVEGQPAADQVILRYVATRNGTLPIDLAGGQAVAGVAATAQTDFDIRKNRTSVGTMSFAPGATAATFGVASEVTLVAGSVLTVVAPGTPDGTLADLAISLLGAAD